FQAEDGIRDKLVTGVQTCALPISQKAPFEKTDSEKNEIRVPQLLAGDTLFAGSIGRTDLWGGSMEEIMDSLRGKLMHLPDATIVHPGHGPMTTIGRERETNPFLRAE